jgi:FO synthase
MRAAADELRAPLAGDTVTFVVNRNINVSNICTVGCAFCGFGQGKRSPDAYEHSEEEFRRRVREAIDYGASEICMQSGIHPDWDLGEYERWLRVAKDEAPHIHLHAYSPMEVAHMSDVSGLAPRAVFERLREAGLDSTPGTAAEVLHDGVRQRISPNKLPVARWVEVIEASHAAGLRSTVTVMFGHVEEPWELAEHMRVVRELQERTGGFTEFVPLSFIPFHTLLGRTHGIEEISREENLKHTAAFRLALGRSVSSLQASWV